MFFFYVSQRYFVPPLPISESSGPSPPLPHQFSGYLFPFAKPKNWPVAGQSEHRKGKLEPIVLSMAPLFIMIVV